VYQSFPGRFVSHPFGMMGIMLTTSDEAQQILDEYQSVDAMEQELVRLEGLISRVRARQVAVIEAVDSLQVPYWDGTRSLKEWIAGRLDIQPRNAADLAVLAKTVPGPIRDSLKAGVVSVDRAAATTRWLNTGASQDVLDEADGVSVGQIGRLGARHRSMRCSRCAAYGSNPTWVTLWRWGLSRCRELTLKYS
jgi:hypothetical protein